MLKVGKEKRIVIIVQVRHLLYGRCPRTQGPGIRKQHLDQNHAKLINSIDIKKGNQHVLAEEVPKSTNKNQILH